MSEEGTQTNEIIQLELTAKDETESLKESKIELEREILLNRIEESN